MVATTSAVEKGVPIRMRFGRFEVDEVEARLLDDGAPVRLAPKPFAVLCALARTPHALVTKSALLDRVWGHRHVSESVLKTTISDVRAVLDDDPRQPRYIETVSCRGYRFIGAQVQAGVPEALRRTGTERPDGHGGPSDGDRSHTRARPLAHRVVRRESRESPGRLGRRRGRRRQDGADRALHARSRRRGLGTRALRRRRRAAAAPPRGA